MVLFFQFELRIAVLGGLYSAPFSRSTSPFLRFPLSRNPRCPIFYRPIGKTKVLNNCFNQFVYNFYPQRILILEEHLQKRSNTNQIQCLQMFLGQFYEKWVSVRESNIKLLLETVTSIANTTEWITCKITIKTVMCIIHCRKYHLHNSQQRLPPA